MLFTSHTSPPLKARGKNLADGEWFNWWGVAYLMGEWQLAGESLFTYCCWNKWLQIVWLKTAKIITLQFWSSEVKKWIWWLEAPWREFLCFFWLLEAARLPWPMASSFSVSIITSPSLTLTLPPLSCEDACGSRDPRVYSRIISCLKIFTLILSAKSLCIHGHLREHY